MGLAAGRRLLRLLAPSSRSVRYDDADALQVRDPGIAPTGAPAGKKNGSLRVKIQDQQGKPLPGFSLTDSKEIIGDNLEHPVQWKQQLDTSKLNGKTIRLRFIMKNANLYSFQFQQKKERP